MFYPLNIKKIVSKLYSIVESENGRTTELIESIKSEQFNHFFWGGVFDGDNLSTLAKHYQNISFIGV
jgi:hypothetical protein